MKSELSVGFDFTAIWFDEGRIQLCISAWNGSFGGTIEVYEAHGKLEKAAGTLAGFPLNLLTSVKSSSETLTASRLVVA